MHGSNESNVRSIKEKQKTSERKSIISNAIAFHSLSVGLKHCICKEEATLLTACDVSGVDVLIVTVKDWKDRAGTPTPPVT